MQELRRWMTRRALDARILVVVAINREFAIRTRSYGRDVPDDAGTAAQRKC
jgi:hypothetical protein